MIFIIIFICCTTVFGAYEKARIGESTNGILSLTNVDKKICDDGKLDNMVETGQIPFFINAKPRNQDWRDDYYISTADATTAEQLEDWLMKLKTIEAALSHIFRQKNVISVIYYPTLNSFTIYFHFYGEKSRDRKQYEEDLEILNQYITKIR